MRRLLVAGNWKMNGSREANAALVSEILDGARGSGQADLLICPPYPYLDGVGRQVAGSRVALGAQNLSEKEAGAFTGEVSASMLVDMECSYVIVGHSERRALYGETSELVAAKFRAASDAGLRPILCVGETLEQREAGRTADVVGEQLGAVLELVGIEGFADAVMAYEPVWAIGTGVTASPDQAQEVHRQIRAVLAGSDEQIADELLILYGGSVKGDNAKGLFEMPDIDGGLIGGAALQAKDFLAIARAAAEI